MGKGFAQVLKQKREELGLSVQELAQKTGVPERLVEAMEEGKFIPPSFFIGVLAQVLEDRDGELKRAYAQEAVRCFSFG